MTILTEEQTMLQDMAKAWVRDHAPLSVLRAARTTHAATGFDPARYTEMAELGWTGMLIPEAYGGYAFGFRSLGLVLEELGRTLTPSPLLASAVTGASALSLGGSEDQKTHWLPRIASGEIIAALALDEGPRHAPESIAMTADAVESGNGGWTLNGIKRPVLEGTAANLFIVAARTGGTPGEAEGISLFLCPRDIGGLECTSLRQIDSRGAAILSFDNVLLDKDALIGLPGKGFPILERILDRSRAALAAEMLGSAVQAFETTVEYLRTRVQFGRPIGSFQALQHRATDLLGEIELARTAVYAALDALDANDSQPDDSKDVRALVSLAKALTGKTLRHTAREMVQMHGGIGMTDEHDAGLYLKRAQAADMAFGNVAFHRERYGTLAGL